MAKHWQSIDIHIMQVSTANDVKVYNVSTGKSLPEVFKCIIVLCHVISRDLLFQWITERKRRKLLKNDEGTTLLCMSRD